METIGVDFEIVTGVLTPAGLLQLGAVPEMPRGMRLPRAACSGSKGVTTEPGAHSSVGVDPTTARQLGLACSALTMALTGHKRTGEFNVYRTVASRLDVVYFKQHG